MSQDPGHMTTIRVVGGTTFDVFASSLSRLPEVDDAGDEFTQRSLVHLEHAPALSVGGNAGNIAFVLSRLGVDTHLYTSLGHDPLGRWLAAMLEETGCEVSPLPPRQTSFNFVATDVRGGRRSYFHPVQLETESALRLLDSTPIGASDHLVLAGYPHPPVAVLKAWASRAHASGASVSLDIGPATAGVTLSALVHLLPHLDLLFCNERELVALDTGERPSSIADYLAREVGLGLVIKRGQVGSEFIGRNERITMPATPIQARITVGAGDAFDAGVIHARFKEEADMAKSLRFATALVAFILRRGRGVAGAPTASEVPIPVPSHPPSQGEQTR
jgi:sugar/nucleoside kinase (ribokinase family)